MRHYGIIGYPLSHSFSAKYFAEKFEREHIDAEYSLYPIASEDIHCVKEYIARLDGMNVTMPYKQTIMAYLDHLDETAQAVGAVNVVYKGTGYNTDCLGFISSLKPLLRDYDKQALVLGTGGAAKAVIYGLKQLGIQPTVVSRTPKGGQIGYDELTNDILSRHTIIVNCTPLGMFPDINDCPPIPYEKITAKHLLFDCVYNPQETLFLKKGKERGALIRNGMEMLYGQAKAAWQIWNEE